MLQGSAPVSFLEDRCSSSLEHAHAVASNRFFFVALVKSPCGGVNASEGWQVCVCLGGVANAGEGWEGVRGCVGGCECE